MGYGPRNPTRYPQHTLEQALINTVRLAHVHQWQRNFKQSNTLLLELVQQADFSRFEAWVCQHAAKNWYDQGNYKRALSLFERAMEIRQQKGDASRIQSTQLGIDACHHHLE